MEWIKIILLFTTLLTVRPAVLGEHFTVLGLATCGLAFIIHLAERIKFTKIEMNKSFIPALLFISIYWTYIIAQTTFTASPMAMDIIKGFATTLFITITFAFILSETKIRYKVFKLFIRTMILLVLSYLVTIAITFVKPIDSLLLIQFQVYEDLKNIYLPFTPIYGLMTVDGHVFQRFLGVFRESGISQAFMVWAYVSLDRYGMKKVSNQIILIVGIICTFSTAGIAVLISTIALKMFLEGKKFLSLFVIPMIYLGLMYAPYVGLADKMTTHGSSITDRTGSMGLSLQLFSENLLGVGIGNSPIPNYAGINLVSSLHMIGIIGLLLILLVYFYPLIQLKNRGAYLIGIFPLFLTALLSQPIIDSPIMLVMIFVCVANAQTLTEEVHTKSKPRKVFKKKIVWNS